MARTGAAELLVWQAAFVTSGEKHPTPRRMAISGSTCALTGFFKADLSYCVLFGFILMGK